LITLSQFNAAHTKSLLDSPEAQSKLITESIELVK
jgi:hypothetical protein